MNKKKKIIIPILMLMLIFTLALALSACIGKSKVEIEYLRVYVRPQDSRKGENVPSFELEPLKPVMEEDYDKYNYLYDGMSGNYNNRLYNTAPFDPKIYGENRPFTEYYYNDLMGNLMLGGCGQYDNYTLKLDNDIQNIESGNRLGTYAYYTEKYMADDLRKGTYENPDQKTVQYFKSDDSICFEAKIKTKKEFNVEDFRWDLKTCSVSYRNPKTIEKNKIHGRLTDLDADGYQYFYAEYKVENTPYKYGMKSSELEQRKTQSRIVHQGYHLTLKQKFSSKQVRLGNISESVDDDENIVFKYRASNYMEGKREEKDYELDTYSTGQGAFDRIIHDVLYDIDVSDITTNSAKVKVNVNDIDNIIKDSKSKVHLYAFYPRIYEAEYEYAPNKKIKDFEFQEYDEETDYRFNRFDFRKQLVKDELFIKKAELKNGENIINLTGLKSGYPVCLYITESYKTVPYSITYDDFPIKKYNQEIVYRIPAASHFETKWLIDVAYEGEITDHINEENPRISTADVKLKIDADTKVKIKDASFELFRFRNESNSELGIEDIRGHFYYQINVGHTTSFEEDHFTTRIAEDEKSIILAMEGLLKNSKPPNKDSYGYGKDETLVLIYGTFTFEATEDIENLAFGEDKIPKGEVFEKELNILFKW